MRFKFLIFILIIIISSCTSRNTNNDNRIIDTEFHYEYELINEILIEIIRYDPGNICDYLFLGGAYADIKNYKLAMAYYNKALQLDPYNKSVYILRGFFYQFQNKILEQAIIEYSKIIELDPDDYMAFFARGWAYSMMGDLYSAEIDLESSFKLYQNIGRWIINNFDHNTNFQRVQQKIITDHVRASDSGINDVILNITWSDRKVNVVIDPKPNSDILVNQSKIQKIIKILKFGIADLKDDNIVILDHMGNILYNLTNTTDSSS